MAPELNTDRMDEILDECMELAKKKFHDYGTYNITETGLAGIAVRMHDKTARLVELIINNKGAKVSDEKLEDTFKDIINYAVYGIMLSEGTFLKEDEKCKESVKVIVKYKKENDKEILHVENIEPPLPI